MSGLDRLGIPEKNDPDRSLLRSGPSVDANAHLEGEQNNHSTADSTRKVDTLKRASALRKSRSKKLDPGAYESAAVAAVMSDRLAILDRLANCGEALAYRDRIDRETGEVSGVVSFHSAPCGMHLLCPFCAAARAGRTVHRYAERCDAVLQAHEGLSPRLVPYLVTLTVKDGPDLMERFNALQKAFRSLIKRVTDGRPSHFAWMLGGAYGIEIKRGSGSRLWHPHVHMVALGKVEWLDLDLAAMKREWLSWTGDSHVLNIKPLRPDSSGSYASSLCEVFKYTTSFKSSDMSEIDRFIVHAHLRGKRLLGNFGLLRDPALDPLESSAQYRGFRFFEFDHEFEKYREALAALWMDSHNNPVAIVGFRGHRIRGLGPDLVPELSPFDRWAPRHAGPDGVVRRKP